MRYLVPVLGLIGVVWACSDASRATADATPPGPPNVILILTDDQGYGDVGCFGSPKIRTPHLDRLASEGLKLTNFYAFPSCSPSRAALLTGCYPPRVGIPDVIGPPGPAWTADKQYGLDPERTTTLADLLRDRGYATAMVGKWHLGHFPATMPRRHGFESFFGLPYSNDMWPQNNPLWPDLPLLDNGDTLALNPDQTQLVGRYTAAAVEFIRTHREQPFFLYLAHSMPHVPLYASAEYAGRSGQGLYADVIEEVDASVGALLATLAELGLDDNTLVIYTSDNGPWLTYGNHAGSAGPFREGKGTTFEGGMRVPFLARWPAGIPAGGVSHTPAALIDILPTVAALAGADAPPDYVDGRNLASLLRGGAIPASRPFFYYLHGQVQAVRRGPWKLHLPHGYRSVAEVGNDGVGGTYDYSTEIGLALYHLADDPGEVYNLADQHPELVTELQQIAADYHRELQARSVPAWTAETAATDQTE
jgi:arylsulfatase